MMCGDTTQVDGVTIEEGFSAKEFYLTVEGREIGSGELHEIYGRANYKDLGRGGLGPWGWIELERCKEGHAFKVFRGGSEYDFFGVEDLPKMIKDAAGLKI